MREVLVPPILSQEIYFQITSVPQVSTLDGLCPLWIGFSNVLLQVNVAIDYILQMNFQGFFYITCACLYTAVNCGYTYENYVT